MGCPELVAWSDADENTKDCVLLKFLFGFATFNTLREVWNIGDAILYMPLWGESIDKGFLRETQRHLHCLMDDGALYCGPPAWIVVLQMTVNLGVCVLILWACRRCIKSSFFHSLRMKMRANKQDHTV